MKPTMATMRMCLKESSYFGIVNLAHTYLIKLFGTLFMLMIWRMIAPDGVEAGGMTYQQLATFTLMTSILSPMLDVRTPVSSWLHEGTLLSLYQRPMGVMTQLVSMTLGRWGTHLVFFSLPLYLLMPALGGSRLPASPWFLPSLCLAVTQGFLVDFLFACLIVRAANLSWQIESLRRALTGLLTGAVIPFSLLPWGIGQALELSPMGTLAGATLSLYIGSGDAARLLPAQAFWTAVLLPLSLYLFHKSTERMMSYGG